MHPRALIFDLATYYDSLSVVDGVERFRWNELDCEMDAWRSERFLIEKSLLDRKAELVRPKPWPGSLMRSKLPVDVSERWLGVTVRFWRRSSVGEVFSLAGEMDLGRAACRLAELSEVQAWAGPVFRGRSENEQKGLLGQPAVYVGQALAEGLVAVEVADNDFFEPFDLRKEGDFLFFVGEREVSRAEALTFGGGLIFLFLRPRQWRYFARVIAHYLYFTIFEEALNDEVFLKVYYHRFPAYPWRVDLATARNVTIWHPYEGQYLYYDYAIDQQWQRSRACSQMRKEMFDQQWVSLCAGYVFLYAEPAAITVWREKPAVGETVCLIGFGTPTCLERVVRVVRKGGTDAYPRTLIGSFWGDAP